MQTAVERSHRQPHTRAQAQMEAAVISISIAVAVAVVTYASGLLGLYLQRRLPETHMSGGSKDMILRSSVFSRFS